MKAQEVFQAYSEYILNTYTRSPLIFVKGKGMKLIDIHNKEYLDFFPGWGVSNLGHCHPKVMAAVRDQVSKLIHIPNNLYHMPQAKLAKEIIYWSFKGKVFFGNSGTEANEGAIKFARAYGKGKRFEIISFKNSFHGRTLASLAATGQQKYQNGFSPIPEGFKIVEFNNIESVKSALSEKTVAVMIELIQGEGGINVADKEFVMQLQQLCKAKDLLLIVDEVQTGMGRTGKMFCYQHYDITPDIMTLAKSIAGGLPMGVMVVQERITETFKPGMHASTFGGSPLACKAALAMFTAIQKEKLLKNAQVMSAYLFEKLNALKLKHPRIAEVRGVGLMVGIELNFEGKSVVEKCLKNGLIINCTHEKVLRMMPALQVTKA
ncbi:aspartate aminotransferase family protein, partial [Candidatus Omnitrophota bacterium]